MPRNTTDMQRQRSKRFTSAVSGPQNIRNKIVGCAGRGRRRHLSKLRCEINTWVSFKWGSLHFVARSRARERIGAVSQIWYRGQGYLRLLISLVSIKATHYSPFARALRSYNKSRWCTAPTTRAARYIRQQRLGLSLAMRYESARSEQIGLAKQASRKMSLFVTPNLQKLGVPVSIFDYFLFIQNPQIGLPWLTKNHYPSI